MKQLLIIGAGGHGRETAQWVKDINRHRGAEWELLGYLDDSPGTAGEVRNGFPVLGGVQLLAEPAYAEAWLICAIGSSRIRQAVMERIEQDAPGRRYATLVHPTAVVGDENAIAPGTMICPQAVVTTNVTLGRHVIINYGCTIGHDTVIEAYATILPGCRLSGNVTIRTGVELGTGVAVIPSVEIGPRTKVGAGATVVRNLPGDCTAVGVPARPIKYHV